jgi:hypothetical protein
MKFREWLLGEGKKIVWVVEPDAREVRMFRLGSGLPPIIFKIGVVGNDKWGEWANSAIHDPDVLANDMKLLVKSRRAKIVDSSTRDIQSLRV